MAPAEAWPGWAGAAPRQTPGPGCGRLVLSGRDPLRAPLTTSQEAPGNARRAPKLVRGRGSVRAASRAGRGAAMATGVGRAGTRVKRFFLHILLLGPPAHRPRRLNSCSVSADLRVGLLIVLTPRLPGSVEFPDASLGQVLGDGGEICLQEKPGTNNLASALLSFDPLTPSLPTIWKRQWLHFTDSKTEG